MTVKGTNARLGQQTASILNSIVLKNYKLVGVDICQFA